MTAIAKDGLDQFRIRFGELAKVKRGEPVLIDPFLIAQTITAVMRECTVRAANGTALVWNDYRVILAKSDFERIRPLQTVLETDLQTVLTQEAQQRKAQLVGALRITVVFDEADELTAGDGVVRVAFVPTDKLTAPRAGEMTMRLDAWQVAGEIVAKSSKKPRDTLIVADATSSIAIMSWADGRMPLTPSVTYVVGRPHTGAPTKFIALTGAPPTVSKQHFWIVATDTTIRVGRFAAANPVHVNDKLVAGGEEIEATLPAEIMLSRGDFVLTVRR